MAEGFVNVLSRHNTTAIAINEAEERLLDDIRQVGAGRRPPPQHHPRTSRSFCSPAAHTWRPKVHRNAQAWRVSHARAAWQPAPCPPAAALGPARLRHGRPAPA